jgi:hypothetical protein
MTHPPTVRAPRGPEITAKTWQAEAARQVGCERGLTIPKQ